MTRAIYRTPPGQVVLFKFNFSSFSLELLLQALSLGLSQTFLNFAWSLVNESLSFLQAKTSELLNEFDNFELVSTSSLEHYVERRFLLLGSSTTSGGTCGNCNSCSGWFDTIFILKDLSELVYFLN